MRKFNHICLAIAASVSIFAAGCSLSGLDPAGSDTVVSFSVSSPLLVAAQGRAVFSSMQLYVRTIGGSTGSSGPLYGPYTVSAGKFSTTEIPAGSYEYLFVIGFSQTPSADMISFLSQPDDALMADTEEDPTGEDSTTALDDELDGYAVVGEFDGVTLPAGRTTSLSTTMLPVCGSQTYLANTLTSTAQYSASYAATANAERFVFLDFSTYSYTGKSTASFTCAGEQSTTSLALYNADGSAISGLTSEGTSFYCESFSLGYGVYALIKTVSADTLSFTMTQELPAVSVTTEAGDAIYSASVQNSTYSTGLYVSGTGDSASFNFKIKNTAATAPLTIYSAALTGWTGTWTLDTSTSFPVSIPANTALDMVLTLAYDGETSPSAGFSLYSDDPVVPEITISFTGSASS